MTLALSDLPQIIARHPELSLRQIDVFCDGPRSGNPAMVVFGGDGLSAAAMQAIASAVNLSETVFILAPTKGADYRARIFTARREIPFAGHPALAAVHAFAEETGSDALDLIQADGLGQTEMVRDRPGGDWRVALPAPRFDKPAPRTPSEIAAMLGLPVEALTPEPPHLVATGVRWLLVGLRADTALGDVRPDHPAIAEWSRASKSVGLVPFVRSRRAGVDAELRSFAPAEGIYEDPVCGSCAGALAALLSGGQAQSFTFLQNGGAKRPGRMRVRLAPPSPPTLSGRTITAIRGVTCPVLAPSLIIKTKETPHD
ncbi:PhzF family phenazine biosynthesis protein [Roseovarius bejariae]|nr:PhzF family phenazine biosynthesis protein [Roseovarius bejariae]